MSITDHSHQQQHLALDTFLWVFPPPCLFPPLCRSLSFFSSMLFSSMLFSSICPRYVPPIMDPGWKEQRWDDDDMKERMIRCGVIVTEAEKGLDASLIQTMRMVKNSNAFFTCAHDEAEEKLGEAMNTFGVAYDQREGDVTFSAPSKARDGKGSDLRTSVGTWRWACEQPTGYVDERGVDLREDMRSMWVLRFHRKTTQSLYGDDEVGEKVRENVRGKDEYGADEYGESELYGADRNWDAPLDVS